MTAITGGDRNTKLLPSRGRNFSSIAAAVLIFEGAIVSLDSSGNVRPARANSADRVLGSATRRVDNSTGLAGAVVGGVDINYDEPGLFENSAGNDAITDAHVGYSCYVVDDQTVALTDNGGARPRAGKIHKVEGGKVWVDFRARPTFVEVPFEIADVGTAETVYKAVPCAGRIAKITTVLHGAITGVDSGISFDLVPLGVIANVADIVGGDITVAVAGSAAGITDVSAPTGGTICARGDSIRIVNDGASTGATKLSGTITIEVAAA